MNRSSVGIGLVVAMVVATSAAVTRAPAATAASRTQVRGIEIVPTHTEGTFTGYSRGALPGDWIAVVEHTPLSPNATITGGTLTLTTGRGRTTRTLTGRFAGGSIANTNPGANCTDQTFRVVGKIADFDGKHTGRFAVTLTHYRHRLLGACLTYFATATGTLAVA